MSQLYAKIDSDIRAGLGCRAEKKLTVKALYNFTRGRKSDGGVVVTAKHTGATVTMRVELHDGDKVTEIGTFSFTKKRADKH